MASRWIFSLLAASLLALSAMGPLAQARVTPLAAAAAAAATGSSTRTVFGHALVIAQDFFWKPPHKFVFVRTPNGSIADVKYSSKAQIAGLQTGSAITVTGDHSPLAGLSGGSLAATDIQKPEARASHTTLKGE